LFFLATVFVAGFVFFGGANFISSKNLDIEVVGPTTASAGQAIELGVTVENNNNTDLEVANLSIQYPQDTRDPQDSSKGLTFTKTDLGVIKAGGEANRNVGMVLLGSVGEIKEIKLSVEYKVRGSNATFYKDKVYQITIGDAPLSLTVESPPKVSSGESFTSVVNVTLNSTEPLKNVMLRAEYPYGFSFDTSSQSALTDNNVWALGDLSPGASKKIEIRGRLVGENQDERTFRFYVGVAAEGGASANFKTVLVSAQETVAIERPSISLSASFNGESVPTYVAPAGQNISTAIHFQNNLPEKLLNPRLEVKLSGTSLNTYTVVAQNNGLYSPGTGRINWIIANALGALALSPGEGGIVTFSFASYPETLSSGNKDINLTITFSGTSAGDNKPVTVSETRTIKIGSQVSFSSRAVHTIGPFSNIGPIPPQVGKETTYTVIWSVGNTSNDLKEAKITAKLGSNVKWVGANSSASESVEYNQSTNTVTWNLGTLPSGVGFSTAPRDAAFQISLTPTSSQVGSAPTLVTGISFSAFDESLNKGITVSSAPLTTRTTSDPAFIQGDDIVVK
jgi:hypothetical protein